MSICYMLLESNSHEMTEALESAQEFLNVLELNAPYHP